jgi:hypothetical protein
MKVFFDDPGDSPNLQAAVAASGVQFGWPIAEHQAIQFKIAQIAQSA